MSDFKKTELQREAVKTLASHSRFVALGGGSRSGKSFIIMYAMIVRAAKTKCRQCILRLNFNHVKRSIVFETFPKVMSLCFPDMPYTLNRTDWFATFPNGSEIFFGGLDSGERVEKLLGSEYSGMWFNEISQIDYASVQIALSRLAEKNSLTKKAYFDLNPGNKSSWPYHLFVKKLDPVDNVPLKNPEDYAYLQMNPAGNLANIDAEYLKLLETFPEKERTRFLLGEFNDESQGQVYYSFRHDINVAPVTKGPGTVYIGQDYNVNPGSGVLLQVVNDKICVFDEVFLENSDTYKMANEFKLKGVGGASVIPDSTGANRKTSGRSDFDIMKEAGFKIEDVRNPIVFDRVNNVNRLLALGKIVIDPRCKKLLNDLQKVVWKDGKPDQSGANKMLTHISDALGYAAWKLMPFNPSTAKVQFDSPRGR